MSTNVLERQIDSVAQHMRMCSDHQRSMVRILKGDATAGALIGDSAGPGSAMPTFDIATTVDPSGPAGTDDTGVRSADIIPTPPSRSDPFQEFYAPSMRATTGPFDDFIASLSTSPARPRPVGPLPPRSRFMMRVASVDRPHRSTKRNYDYFEVLKAALADLADYEGGTPPSSRS
jgi:hypothetical protein